MENTTQPSETLPGFAAKFAGPKEFCLERSRWYSLMMLGNACRNARTCAEQITKWAPILGTFEYEPAAGTELAKAELALSEALLAVQVTRASYERMTKLSLVAAE